MGQSIFGVPDLGVGVEETKLGHWGDNDDLSLSDTDL
jgi:hypothetical protein